MSDQPHPPAENQPADHPPAESAPPPSRKKRKGWKRLLLWGGLAVVLLIGLFVALLPTLLSTAAGTNLVRNVIEGQVNGSVRLDEFDAGWGGPIRVAGLVIEDERGRRVLEVAQFQTEMGVAGAIGGFLSNHYDLGQTVARANLPVVEVYDDGTTNWHEVAPSFFEESDAPTPEVSGDINATLSATVQHLGERGTEADDSPPVAVDVTDARLVLLPEAPLENKLPIALRINGQDAGTINIEGTVDLNAAEPAIRETVTLDDLNLTALSTLASAFGSPVKLTGTAGGTINADTIEGVVDGQITVNDFSAVPYEGDGEGYETSRLALTVNGGMGEGEQIRIDTLKLETDDGTALVSATIDQAKLDADPLAAVTDIGVDVQSDFLTVKGGGQSLGGLELAYTANLDLLQDRFGDLIDTGGMDAGGRLAGTIQTRTRMAEEGGAIDVILTGEATNLVLADTNEPAEGEAPKPPLRIDLATLRLQAALAENAEGQQSIPTASLELSADDFVTVNAKASEIDAATSSIGRLELAEVALTDYAKARETLAGWVELPEPTGEVGPVAVTGALTWDGTASRVEVVEPLVVTSDETTLASLDLAAALPAGESGEGEAEAPAEPMPVRLAVSVPDLPALNQFLGAFDLALSGTQAPEGSLAVVFEGEMDPAAEAFAASLVGDGELRLTGTRVAGIQFDGALPIVAAEGRVGIPADAEPLEANEGALALAGTNVDLDSMILSLPDGEILSGVSLNPVLTEALGQFLNPVFVGPEEATGLLDIKLVNAGNLNLNDPFGPEGGQIEVSFSVRQLNIQNDIIAAFADGAAEQVAQAIPSTLRQIPKVQTFLNEKLDISEEVKEEISGFRGSILDARVGLNNGVADSTITFNISDPRLSAAEATEADVYPLTFTGDVNLETLAADLSVTIPRNLVEKWAGENPGDLVEIFGPEPFAKLIPNGVTIGIDGTTAAPRPDVSDIVNNLIPRAARAALQGGIENQLREGLEKGLQDLFN